MAKKFVKITLATKLRMLFGAALLGIIATALGVPWLFMELLAEQGVQRPAAELSRLAYNEFALQHAEKATHPRDALGPMAAIYAKDSTKRERKENKGRKGPSFISLAGPNKAAPKLLKGPLGKAVHTFRDPKNDQDMLVIQDEDDQGKTVYRCFRQVRAGNSCITCHKDNPDPKLQFRLDDLVGVIDTSLPGSAASGALVWWTRGAFMFGGVLAAVLAFVLFTIITQRLIIRPVRRLQHLADKVTEGDLSVRSTVKTGDELQRLGDSFNEMLVAITDQHEKLRSANRALDLKLSELAEANVTLAKANQVKNEFLANVSHELRTPLNSIIGFADLVSSSGNERLGRYGQNIVSSAKNLLSMINDILDLAKIEAGRAEVRFDQVSVTDTCQTLAALMKPLADKKQLDLRTELAQDIPLVNTDGGKVQQILYNLLSNAIKFTPAGGSVLLSTRMDAYQRDGQTFHEIVISVSDTGPGIAEADQQQIFEKFHRLDQALTRESSGTGLGLAISKELASLIGGRLGVRSEPGHGATFTLTLPEEPKQ